MRNYSQRLVIIQSFLVLECSLLFVSYNQICQTPKIPTHSIHVSSFYWTFKDQP